MTLTILYIGPIGVLLVPAYRPWDLATTTAGNQSEVDELHVEDQGGVGWDSEYPVKENQFKVKKTKHTFKRAKQFVVLHTWMSIIMLH